MSPLSEAWTTYPEIELRTGKLCNRVIVLDVDGSNALERMSVASVDQGQGAREPNWMVTRKDGGGTHMAYTLARPVLTRAGHAGRTDPGC